MLSSGTDQKRLLDLGKRDLPMRVYDKYQNTTAVLEHCFSSAFENPVLTVKGCLTEKEKSAFNTLYTDLPSILLESIAELDSLLELRNQMDAASPHVSEPSAPPPRRSKKPNLKGKRFTERSEQLLNKIEEPISMALWDQLLSLDGSFMNDEQLRSEFFVCVMRQVWSSPSKRRVLDDLLARFRIDRSDAVSVDRMFPYFAYHQIAIHSIVLSSNLQYHLSFLRIPRGARYKFIVTDNPAIDLYEGQMPLRTEDTNRFLWVIAPTAAVIITDKTAGKTRFVTEREVAMYNTLLFKKANRYILLDPDDDILSGCC